MDHIVVLIHPFVRLQEIDIFHWDECIKTYNCTLEEIEDTVVRLCKEYHINQVDTFGGQLYVMKMKDHLEKKAITEYDCPQINLNIH